MWERRSAAPSVEAPAVERFTSLSTPLVLAPLAPEVRAQLLTWFSQTDDADARLRYQMLLLSSDRGPIPSEIAEITFRSHDTVLRVISRFREGGLEAVPYHWGPGRALSVSEEWQSELARVIELDPRLVEVESANWTTKLLADYLEKQTAILVDQETVRKHLHKLGYVYKRPNWTVRHKAEEREGYLGNA
jgi:transposase